MPAALPYSKQTPGRTFIIAISVLGIVAFTQIGALGWAFVQRVKRGPIVTAASKPAPLDGAEETEGDDPNQEGDLVLSDPFTDPANGVVASRGNGPIMPPAKPQPVPATRVDPAPDTRFGELLQQGKTLRDRGDTGNALIRFREAYALDPRNPSAIAEMAVTYEKMGLPEKAAEQWKRIFDMGESGGVYFSAAEAKMKQAVMAAQASVQGADTSLQATGGTLASAILGLGTIATEDAKDPKALKHFTTRVPIQLRNKTRIAVKDVVIQVLFYDLVDEKPQRTNANVSSRFSTAPVDWRDDDTEVLEVEYNQPAPDPRDPKRENRKYFGYLVRIYYKDELQATRADPPALGQKFPASQTLEKDAAQ